MGASRKLQGEIDRVLKKISASYEQSLVDGWKLIEREMEMFKICEKETKTKAFSKEGLGQQPNTDPKERAKSETRDWLNNVFLYLLTFSLCGNMKCSGNITKNFQGTPLSMKSSVAASALPSPKPPSSVADAPLRGIGRVSIPNQPQDSQPSQPSSPIPANGARFSATSAAEVAKRNIMGVKSNVQPLTSPLSKMVLPPTAKGNDGTTSDINPSEVAASIGRAFSPSVVSGSQWRPGSPFQSQNETSSAISPQGSLGTQAPGFNVMSSASLQQQSNAMTQQLGQQPYVTAPDDSTSIAASKAILQMRMILKPKIAADEYEQGAYVYFDFQTPKDESQEGGW
uniref:CCR4-Not complex component Not N-terminal domain-containing protein n=1 Tax=Brassica campestris TaxID=3711 RepID=M4E4G5_BRACM